MKTNMVGIWPQQGTTNANPVHILFAVLYNFGVMRLGEAISISLLDNWNMHAPT